MKTKLLISILFLVSMFQTSFSQEYKPLLYNSCWIVNDVVSCCRPPYIRMIHEGVDVTIGEYTYKRFNDPFPEYDIAASMFIDSVFVREDAITKKVYKYVNGADVLLYDFSLETGDTILLHGYNWTATVDEVEVIGVMHKRITLNSVETWNDYVLTQIWIEGIGTNAHPFYPQRNMYSVGATGGGLNYFTKCAFQNGMRTFGQHDCDSLLSQLETPENTLASKEISFSPNPFSTEFTIRTATPLQNGSVTIHNVQGQIVRTMRNLSGDEVVVGRENLSNGLYFVQLYDNDVMIKSLKLLAR